MHRAIRKMGHFWGIGSLALLAAAALLCAPGCGSGDSAPKAAASRAHKGKKAADAPALPAEQSLNEMVAAVTPSKGPPIELKFALPLRPEVGQVSELDVALVPSQPLPDSVSLSFQVVEGLEIVAGAQMDRVEKLTAGVPIRHVVKVLPKRDGIFAISAVVSFVTSNVESTRTFSIPVIAGVGMPDQVAKGP